LTSVDQGSERIGKSAAELALALANRKVKAKAKVELVSPRVVVRNSSQRKV
jgi:LacI family transcriptional regulator